MVGSLLRSSLHPRTCASKGATDLQTLRGQASRRPVWRIFLLLFSNDTYALFTVKAPPVAPLHSQLSSLPSVSEQFWRSSSNSRACVASESLNSHLQTIFQFHSPSSQKPISLARAFWQGLKWKRRGNRVFNELSLHPSFFPEFNPRTITQFPDHLVPKPTSFLTFYYGCDFFPPMPQPLRLVPPVPVLVHEGSPCRERISLFHKLSPSIKNLHTHLQRRARLKEVKFLKPSPPSFLGQHKSYHLIHGTFLPFSSPPQRKLQRSP